MSITEQTREVALEHWTLGGELRVTPTLTLLGVA